MFEPLAQEADAPPPDVLIEACGEDPSYACEQVYEWTENELAATAAEWLLARPLQILFIVIFAWIVSKVLQRVVRRFVATIAATPNDDRIRALRARSPGGLLIDDTEKKRALARAETIQLVLRSIVVAIVWTIAILTVLGQLDIDLAPLIAGAGIGGIALGFGAQSIVRDFLSGLFMLIEDQYGVGDIVDVGEASGTVEKMSLRSTTLRDIEGTVWHVPNGEILRVGNYSQLWSRALLDVEVSYDTDIEFAQGVIQRVADELWQDPAWGGQQIMERPEVWGVESLGASSVAIRLVVKTEPSEQWNVQRELRMRLKLALDAAGIEIPFPQQTLWFRNQGDHPMDVGPDPAGVVTHAVHRGAGDDAGEPESRNDDADEGGSR